MLVSLLLFFLGFALVWIGSGLAVRNVEILSQRLHFSSFAVSFLFLGFFTSLTEISVGLTALVDRDPQIYVGNLLGGSIVIFLLLIPLLAIAGNGLTMVHSLQRKHLILVLLTIAAPAFLIFDQTMSLADAVILVALYCYLFFTLHEERGMRAFLQSLLVFREASMLRVLGSVLVGVVIFFIASRLIVGQGQYCADLAGVSPFVLSLLLGSGGSNIPELSIAVRSVLLKKNEVALGNYLGSSAFNTLLMGGLTLLGGQSIMMNSRFTASLVFLVSGLGLFYVYGKSNAKISRKEGVILFAVYILFVVVELWQEGA